MQTNELMNLVKCERTKLPINVALHFELLCSKCIVQHSTIRIL